MTAAVPCSFCGAEAQEYGLIVGTKILCRGCNALKRAPAFATTTARLNTAVATPAELPLTLEAWSLERFELLQKDDPLFGYVVNVVTLWRCTVLVPR
jgi:hypothetical protein